MTVRIGFLGAGFITAVHGFWLRECGVDHEVVAVHDPDAGRAARFAERHGAAVLGEEALLERVDAVYVVPWTSEHPRLVEMAATRGKAVFCEKPLATDAVLAGRMVEAVRAAGVVNQVGLVLRSLPSFRFLRELVNDPRAGRTMTVVFRDDQYLPTQGQYASDWRGDAARAGRGALLEHSIHDLDILRWMFGEVGAVGGVVREFHGLPRIDDLAVARLDFASGAVATLTSVWHDQLERPSQRRVEVFCERLHAVLEGDFEGPVRWRFTGDEERMLDGPGLADAVSGDGWDTNPATVFLRAVRDGTAATPDFAEALPAHRLADAIYASAEAGGAPIMDPEAAAV